MNKLHFINFFCVLALSSCAYAMNNEAILEQYTLQCSRISKGYMRATINTMACMLEHNEENDADEQVFEALRSSVIQHAPYDWRRKQLYNAAVKKSAALFKAWLSTCKLSDVYEYNYDEDNNSLPHLVCGSPESEQKMQALIDAGANTRVRNKRKKTPLEYAQEKGDAAVQSLFAARNILPSQPTCAADLTTDLTADGNVVDLTSE